MRQTRLPGVIGGMGPQATIEFLQRVSRRTGGGPEQNQLRLLVDQNPQIPNRHEAIINGNDDVGPVLLQMGRGLQAAGADFLVMPCNTAHAFAGPILRELDIPLLSMVESVKHEVQKLGETLNVGLLAADGCLISGVYHDALSGAVHEVLTLSANSQAQFMHLVYRIKAGEISPEITKMACALMDQLADQGADILIAGCTEVPLMMGEAGPPLPCIDTLQVLVEATIQFACSS